MNADHRVEVRALEEHRSVVSVDEHHHVVGLAAADLLRLLDHWTGYSGAAAATDGLVTAAEPLQALISELDGFTGGDSPARHTELPPVVDLSDPAEPQGPLVTGDADLAAAIAAATEGTAVAHDPRATVNRAFRTGELLVVVVRGPHDTDLVDIDRMCHDMRVRWMPVELTRDRAWVGPLVTPGDGATYPDAVMRRASAAYDRRVHRVLRHPSLTGERSRPAAALPKLVDAVADLVNDRDLVGDEIHEVASDGTRTVHSVLPMPDAATTHRPHRPQDLVDPVTGLVLRTRTIDHDPSVPPSLVTRQCDVADVRAVSRWANNVLCQGSSFGDADGASRAALGESVERYCANILDTLPVTLASHDELVRRGVPAMDPRELVLYSEAQYAAPGFPFVPLDRDTRVHWVPGRSVTREEEVWVPASLVYVNWYAAGNSRAPITNFCAFAGIAAGPDLDFAVTSGLEEVIERHATMVWWLNGHPLPPVRPTAELRAPWHGVDPARQRPTLIHLDNEFDVPVAAAVVHDDTDRLVNVGFSARPTFAAAALKAWTEALTLQEGSRDLLRMDGLHWDVMARGELNGRAFKPWRADRRYLDDFRPDMHDCDDLMVQQQVYLDPRAGQRMAHLLEPTAPTREIADAPTVGSRSSADYRAAVESRGHEVIVVDLTTPDVASTGMAVVRVLVPGTVGNAPAAFPFLGRRRVQDLAVELGWRDEALAENELNHFPMPHA